MNEQKFELNSKRHRQKMIKNWMIAVVVAIIIIWAFAGMPALELKSKSIEILKSIFLWSVSPRFRLYIHTCR